MIQTKTLKFEASQKIKLPFKWKYHTWKLTWANGSFPVSSFYSPCLKPDCFGASKPPPPRNGMGGHVGPPHAPKGLSGVLGCCLFRHHHLTWIYCTVPHINLPSPSTRRQKQDPLFSTLCSIQNDDKQQQMHSDYLVSVPVEHTPLTHAHTHRTGTT